MIERSSAPNLQRLRHILPTCNLESPLLSCSWQVFDPCPSYFFGCKSDNFHGKVNVSFGSLFVWRSVGEYVLTRIS